MRAVLCLLLCTLTTAAFGQGAWRTYDHTISVKPRNVSGEMGIAVPLSVPLPAYPTQMMSAGIGGEATLSFVVREDGSVADVAVVNASQQEFADPAKEAVAHWKFYPPKHRHTQAPTKVKMTVRIEFKMDDE